MSESTVATLPRPHSLPAPSLAETMRGMVDKAKNIGSAVEKNLQTMDYRIGMALAQLDDNTSDVKTYLLNPENQKIAINKAVNLALAPRELIKKGMDKVATAGATGIYKVADKLGVGERWDTSLQIKHGEREFKFNARRIAMAVEDGIMGARAKKDGKSLGETVLGIDRSIGKVAASEITKLISADATPEKVDAVIRSIMDGNAKFEVEAHGLTQVFTKNAVQSLLKEGSGAQKKFLAIDGVKEKLGDKPDQAKIFKVFADIVRADPDFTKDQTIQVAQIVGALPPDMAFMALKTGFMVGGMPVLGAIGGVAYRSYNRLARTVDRFGNDEKREKILSTFRSLQEKYGTKKALVVFGAGYVAGELAGDIQNPILKSISVGVLGMAPDILGKTKDKYSDLTDAFSTGFAVGLLSDHVGAVDSATNMVGQFGQLGIQAAVVEAHAVQERVKDLVDIGKDHITGTKVLLTSAKEAFYNMNDHNYRVQISDGVTVDRLAHDNETVEESMGVKNRELHYSSHTEPDEHGRAKKVDMVIGQNENARHYRDVSSTQENIVESFVDDRSDFEKMRDRFAGVVEIFRHVDPNSVAEHAGDKIVGIDKSDILASQEYLEENDLDFSSVRWEEGVVIAENDIKQIILADMANDLQIDDPKDLSEEQKYLAGQMAYLLTATSKTENRNTFLKFYELADKRAILESGAPALTPENYDSFVIVEGADAANMLGELEIQDRQAETISFIAHRVQEIKGDDGQGALPDAANNILGFDEINEGSVSDFGAYNDQIDDIDFLAVDLSDKDQAVKDIAAQLDEVAGHDEMVAAYAIYLIKTDENYYNAFVQRLGLSGIAPSWNNFDQHGWVEIMGEADNVENVFSDDPESGRTKQDYINYLRDNNINPLKDGGKQENIDAWLGSLPPVEAHEELPLPPEGGDTPLEPNNVQTSGDTQTETPEVPPVDNNVLPDIPPNGDLGLGGEGALPENAQTEEVVVEVPPAPEKLGESIRKIPETQTVTMPEDEWRKAAANTPLPAWLDEAALGVGTTISLGALGYAGYGLYKDFQEKKGREIEEEEVYEVEKNNDDEVVSEDTQPHQPVATPKPAVSSEKEVTKAYSIWSQGRSKYGRNLTPDKLRDNLDMVVNNLARPMIGECIRILESKRSTLTEDELFDLDMFQAMLLPGRYVDNSQMFNAMMYIDANYLNTPEKEDNDGTDE